MSPETIMQVRDVMTSPAITVGPDTPFPDVVDVLLHNDVSGLPVVDESGALVGMVTEADLVSKEAYGMRRRRPLALIGWYLRGHDPQWVRKAAGQTAADVMTALPITVSPGDSIAFAARTMLDTHHKRLPVVENDRVVGIVSRHDLLTVFHRTDDDLQTDMEELLDDVLRVPESHHARASVSGGVVTLDGDALYPSDVKVLVSVASHVPGVVAVENHLSAREPEPRAKDVY